MDTHFKLSKGLFAGRANVRCAGRTRSPLSVSILLFAALTLPKIAAAQQNWANVSCPAYCVLVTSSGGGTASLSIAPISPPPSYYGYLGSPPYYPYYVVKAQSQTGTQTVTFESGTGASITGTITGLPNGLIQFSVTGTDNITSIGTESGQVMLFTVPVNAPTLMLNNEANSLGATASLTTNASGIYSVFVGSPAGSESFYVQTSQNPFTYTGLGLTCFQVATSPTATFDQRSGEVCTYLYDAAATPTLPEWATILLGVTLLCIAIRFPGNLRRETYG